TPIANFRLGAARPFDRALAVDSAGSIYVGGGQTSGGSTLATLAKYLPSGTAAWTKTIGSVGAGNEVLGVAVASNETIVAMGHYPGRLPQQPPSATGHGFELRYAGDGTLLQSVQSASITAYPFDLYLDPSGESYFLNNLTVAKLDPAGVVIWSSPS